METKKPWQSKTILLNSLGLILMALVPFMPGAEAVSAWISANASLIGTIWGALNILLRFITKDRVQLFD